MKLRPIALALILALAFASGGSVREAGAPAPADDVGRGVLTAAAVGAADHGVADHGVADHGVADHATADAAGENHAAGDDAGTAGDTGMGATPDPPAIDRSTRLSPVLLAAHGPPARRPAPATTERLAYPAPRAGSSPRYLEHCALLC